MDHGLYFLWSCGRVLDKVLLDLEFMQGLFLVLRAGGVTLPLSNNFLHHHTKSLGLGDLNNKYVCSSSPI